MNMTPMTPLFDYWAIEYNFHCDTFTLTPLGEHLRQVQQSFASGMFFGGQLLAIHPNEKAAQDEIELWQRRRDAKSLPREDAAWELLRYASGYLPDGLPEDFQGRITNHALARQPLNR